MELVKFQDVWAMYKIKFVVDGKTSWDNYWALKNICFSVSKGENLGIIGENGAGKTTILKLIAGMFKPDRGNVAVNGRVSGLLELGAGFQPELTGRENVYLSASLFGLSSQEIDKKYNEIIDFAALGKFINAAVKCYSQGMFVRLAFAIAISMNPDVLLIDDTLAVGDEFFQRKCIKKIFELKDQGKTIIFVTHDMNMLNRLCKRVLFIKEGMIVKDGKYDEVVPLYNQTVGERQGVGILEKRLMDIVFNNGRLFLNWQGKLLTPNWGGYAAFLIGGKWYNSAQADWQVSKEGDNRLLAIGKFYQLGLTQIWRLEIADDYEVKWEIGISSQESITIEEGDVNIMLVKEYIFWFTPREVEVFPDITDKDKGWQALHYKDTTVKSIGVEAASSEIPCLAFEQNVFYSGGQAQIANSDYLTNCRLLQYKIFNLHDKALANSGNFNYFSGKIIIGIKDKNKYLQKLQDEFSLSKNKTQITFDSGRLILSYGKKELTKASHVNLSLNIAGRYYYSNLACWEVVRGADKLVLKGVWLNSGISQIWEITMIDDALLRWEVSLIIDREVYIQEQQIRIAFQDDYQYWFTNYGTGMFPNDFGATQVDILQRCLDGKIGLQSSNDDFPQISFKFSKELNNFGKIFNSNFYEKTRIFFIDKVEPEENQNFLPGKYNCFSIDIALSKNENLLKGNGSKVISSRKLKLIFDKGKGCIYFNDVEITKRLGIYTSIRSRGRWHDSVSAALWSKEEINSDTIRAEGKWLDLPIGQFWEMRLVDDRAIELGVTMKVYNKITTERLQTNIMLSERYKSWFINGRISNFPEFKGNIDDDWQVIYSCLVDGMDKQNLGVCSNEKQKNNSIHKIAFCAELPKEEKYLLNVVNSDVYHRGRVLQCLNQDEKIFMPGDYLYFKGKIVIG